MLSGSPGEFLEEWLPVPGWETEYLISNHGRVYSLPRYVPAGGSTRLVGGRLLKLLQNPAGYYCVGLCRGGKRHNSFIHRMVIETFLGPPPFDGAWCCHNDGNPKNNRIDNLRWDTPSGNWLDTVKHGTHNSARKTQCPRGHPLEAPNLIPSALSDGKRSCRSCRKALDWVRRRRREGISTSDSEFIAYAEKCYSDLVEATRAGELSDDIRDDFLGEQLETCPRGHKRFDANIRPNDGSCVACNRASAAVSHRRKTGKPFDADAIADTHYRKMLAIELLRRETSKKAVE